MILKEGQVYEISRKWTSALGSHFLQCLGAEVRQAFKAVTVVTAQRDARRRRGIGVGFKQRNCLDYG